MIKSGLEKQSDAELLTRYAVGEEAAFREIVNRYKDSLYAFLRQFIRQHDLVEDVFQETFLQLFKSRDSFEMSRPLRPWLFTIAANKAKDALRKQQRKAAATIGTIADAQEMSFEEVLNTLTSDKTAPYDELQRNETAVRVKQIITDLPDNLRERVRSCNSGSSYRNLRAYRVESKGQGRGGDLFGVWQRDNETHRDLGPGIESLLMRDVSVHQNRENAEA